jgi:hypothetical protein
MRIVLVTKKKGGNPDLLNRLSVLRISTHRTRPILESSSPWIESDISPIGSVGIGVFECGVEPFLRSLVPLRSRRRIVIEYRSVLDPARVAGRHIDARFDLPAVWSALIFELFLTCLQSP